MRHFRHTTRLARISVLGLGVGLALSACNPGTSPAAAPSATASATASSATTRAATAKPAATRPVAISAPAVGTTPTTAVPTAAPSAALVPMQTAAGGEFLSPTGNISCEIDYHRDGLTQAYCQTGTPPRSVTMRATGTYKTCTGQQCLGNPGTGTPTLAYGTATGVGPFRCESAATGISCVAGGRGFRISASGITPVSA